MGDSPLESDPVFERITDPAENARLNENYRKIYGEEPPRPMTPAEKAAFMKLSPEEKRRYRRPPPASAPEPP